jgi:hypothetical protein
MDVFARQLNITKDQAIRRPLRILQMPPFSLKRRSVPGALRKLIGVCD